ncbi:hypothetical protein [Mycolicibacterium fortuitum]|uniref:hypothetical protein n=1 Tax=Mycolicibacterium fortuitum TaxID=1766 RepID=UPI000AE28294|nr:hypothetical protein [Mycolicibacterium fortuitum]
MNTIHSSSTIEAGYRQWLKEQRRIQASDELTPLEWRWLIRVVAANLTVPTPWIAVNIASQKRIHAKFRRLGWLDEKGYPFGALATYIAVARREVPLAS